MPSALNGQNDYYTRHHRRQSSLSQTSLPDQLRNPLARAYSPSQSAVFLPATTYGKSERIRSQSPALTSGDLSQQVSAEIPFPQFDGSAGAPSGSGDPDEYYRQYQSQFGQPLGSPFRQGAIRPADSDPSTSRIGRRRASETHDGNKSQPNLPGLRSRKSSVKNLVAQINASSTEVPPPLPINAISGSGSRNVSPVISSGAYFSQTSVSRKTSATETTHLSSHTNGVLTGSSSHTGLGVLVRSTQNGESRLQKRPLFGEIISDSPTTTGLGFGIQTVGYRRDSEGSPSLASDPAIPQRFQYHQERNANESSYDQPETVSGSRHRRIRSSSPSRPSNDAFDPNAQPGSQQSTGVTGHRRQQNSASRIPISTHRMSASSNAELNGSGSISPSASKRSSPRRRQRIQSQIQSPGKVTKSGNIVQVQKSPLLRANIIAPPPKASPPLRSSRPRLPISSASSATSRARMAEKFTLMQKLNDQKRAADRRQVRPPELSDIDLKARRLRITQALSRSLEGQELRGNFEGMRYRDLSRSRTVSPTMSDRSQRAGLPDLRNDAPVVVIDAAATSESEREEYQTPAGGTPREEVQYTHNALQLMQGAGSSHNVDNDSPTLGHDGPGLPNKPSPLQTDFLLTSKSYEPSSALTNNTAETDHTVFDQEPQNGLCDPGQTLLSHVTHMRSQSPASTRPASSYGDASDRADQESVQFILRSTTYLDDDEVIRAGYHHVSNNSQSHAENRVNRESWTSSIGQSEIEESLEISRLDSSSPATSEAEKVASTSRARVSRQDQDQDVEGTVRSTMASDAYTIVNIVLQRHSTNGIVDQQFVDDVYQRVLDTSPYDGNETLSTEQIEQMCLQEMHGRRGDRHRSTTIDNTSGQSLHEQQEVMAAVERSHLDAGNTHAAQPQYQEQIPMGLPKLPFRGHRHKSSLDSAEDWANTSPSVSDWMRYAHGDDFIKDVDESTTNTTDQASGEVTLTSKSFVPPQVTTTNDQHDEAASRSEEDLDLYSAHVSRPRTISPVARPVSKTSSLEQSSYGSALIEPPQVPRRITSLAQMGPPTPPIHSRPALPTRASSKASMEGVESPELRRLRRRRHVVKELVDTEFTYEKDLRVLCDIYKQTASAALVEEDIKVLFGNVEVVQEFSRDFLMLLKSVAKPTYIMERADRKKDKKHENSLKRSESSSSTLTSKTPDTETPNIERDRETCIGQAFESSIADMEKIYADYIRNRHAANQRLEIIQKSTAAREWLKECRDNSSDITNAWNLDALLVKPVQRITKYPLLLKELLDATPEDHPDSSFLRRALYEVTEVNIRINDVKKHTELVDQVLNRKRKDSDVRMGLSKAFGRRAEKLKQHVGITEMYEDPEYNEVRIHYDNNIVQLMVVNNDCSSYGRAISRWVNRMVEISTAAEAWVDVGHSNHQEAESKLRQFAMVTRGINTIALPDHLEKLEIKVLGPMQQGIDQMNKFKNDPKGLLQKRDKRLIDYAQAKNKKERGEKVDKKMSERMEQWEALNIEAKERMKKLIKATGSLVQACLASLLQMQMTWLAMVKAKLASAMGIPLERLASQDIEKEWQVDFDFQEALALSLGICNGTLLAEAVNMISFQTPSTTLNGEDSPRQASFTTNRSISMHSEGSQAHIPEQFSRVNASHSRHLHEHPHDRSHHYGYGSTNNRDRATSAASHGFVRTPEPSIRNEQTSKHVSANAGLQSSALGRPDEASSTAPRLSIDTPSPLIGSLQPDTSSHRPPSASTFFSAPTDVPGRSSSHVPQASTASSIFSSAMPMSDSPQFERHPDVPLPDPNILFTAASVFEFNIDRSRREAGFPYLTYVTGEIFDVIGERGELWLAKNQDDPDRQVGWIWNKHFAKLAG